MKTTKWKLHWLPNISELVPLRLVDFDHLITKKKLEEGDAVEDFVNKKSVRRHTLPDGQQKAEEEESQQLSVVLSLLQQNVATTRYRRAGAGGLGVWGRGVGVQLHSRGQSSRCLLRVALHSAARAVHPMWRC